MTKQEIFNQVWRHLMRQGRAAIEVDGTCRYRGPDNTSCAIGCLIPDAFYTPALEGYSALSQVVIDVLVAAGVLQHADQPGFISLLNRLQEAHDMKLRAFGIEAWADKMRSIAAADGLSVPAEVV